MKMVNQLSRIADQVTLDAILVLTGQSYQILGQEIQHHNKGRFVT